MTIHWWHTDKLAQQLAEGGVSELETARYAMIGVVLYFQATYFATWFGGYRDWLLIYEFFVVTAIGLVGINECFKANGGAEGSDFLKRFSVISVPVGVKVTLAAIATGQVIYFGFPYLVTHTTFRDPVHVYKLIYFASAAAFTFIYYWRVTVHLSSVLRRQRSNIATTNRVSIV